MFDYGSFINMEFRATDHACNGSSSQSPFLWVICHCNFILIEYHPPGCFLCQCDAHTHNSSISAYVRSCQHALKRLHISQWFLFLCTIFLSLSLSPPVSLFPPCAFYYLSIIIQGKTPYKGHEGVALHRQPESPACTTSWRKMDNC